ncbi:uncharacterized protein SAPINGB_P005484 [Magnusiomyces paraingens]|uniref:Uncharacterized protein n=1 Tax=Magnusiomyces paraingens TaxID=2606893 RepID=A0A5E8C203_9ASCO|nr:uncharacterized protein SAPINGB_P005484 [Saprochaete ingens]VVT57000.1 unnamed protein product [Saprochaete ingens]
MPVYVPILAGLAATSFVGIAVFLYKNPELVDEVLVEVKNFLLNKKAQIQVKMQSANEFVIREVDDTGRILREKIFTSSKHKEPPMTAVSNKSSSSSSSFSSSSSAEDEKRAFLNPEGYYTGRMPTPSSSGCTTPTSLKGSDAGRDFESLRRRLGPESGSFHAGRSTHQQASSSGFARPAGEGVPGNFDAPDYFTEDGDEDIYAPPTHTKILENIPLEYLEREIRRRKSGSTSVETSYHTVVPSLMTSSSSSNNPFADAFKTPEDEDDDDEPPSLPPKIPIGNDKTYTPQFSRRNSLTSEVSVSSSILSGSVASLSSSWQNVRVPPTSNNGLTDFQEYERQLRDNMGGLNYQPMAGASILAGTTADTSAAQNIQNMDAALSSEPSLVYSCPSSVTLESSSHGLHENPNGDSESEALTPIVSRSSTLDCESVIYQDTSSESGYSNQSSRPRRHVH